VPSDKSAIACSDHDSAVANELAIVALAAWPSGAGFAGALAAGVSAGFCARAIDAAQSEINRAAAIRMMRGAG
jgi:hypothetical protein